MRLIEAVVKGGIIVSVDTDDVLDHINDPGWEGYFCLAQAPDAPKDSLVCYLPKGHEYPWHIDTDLKVIRWAWPASTS